MTILNSQPPVAGVSDADDWVLPLARASDAGIVGGKAVNLCHLIQAGFNVPGGFVVTTTAFHAARESGSPGRTASIPPPQPERVAGQIGAIEEVRIVYPPRHEKSRVFWRSFAWLGWHWDAGWLGVYIAAYVPVMLIAKRLLKVP